MKIKSIDDSVITFDNAMDITLGYCCIILYMGSKRRQL